MQCTSCGQENSPDARVCSRCNTPLPVTPLPVPEIGVGASYSYGWKQLWKHFWMLLLISIIFYAISMVASLLNQGIATLGGLSGIGIGYGAAIGIGIISMIFTFAYVIFLTNPLGYGVNYTFLKAQEMTRSKLKTCSSRFVVTGTR